MGFSVNTPLFSYPNRVPCQQSVSLNHEFHENKLSISANYTYSQAEHAIIPLNWFIISADYSKFCSPKLPKEGRWSWTLG